ncbi:hypothetical protein HNQ61_000208 [Longimicrobium terrae]|uniref:Uncharacterized protein n=1 Tax=Longimicrobium terrae TaxID=1639882 RepID=A0A841GJ62_9BACT|nr:hypothetical protein [Longimicrobium terrae]
MGGRPSGADVQDGVRARTATRFPLASPGMPVVGDGWRDRWSSSFPPRVVVERGMWMEEDLSVMGQQRRALAAVVRRLKPRLETREVRLRGLRARRCRGSRMPLRIGVHWAAEGRMPNGLYRPERGSTSTGPPLLIDRKRGPMSTVGRSSSTEARFVIDRSTGFHPPDAVVRERWNAVGRCRPEAMQVVAGLTFARAGRQVRGWSGRAPGVCLFRLDAGLTFHDCAAPVTVAGLAARGGRRGCRKRARGGADVRDRGVLRPV